MERGSLEESAESRLVRRFYDAAWNRWDDAVIDDLLAEDFQFRGSLGDDIQGRLEWRAYRDRVRSAVPDFHNEIVDLVTSPGRAAARLRYTGHHHGVLLGQRGRGAPIDYAGAAFAPAGASEAALANGKLVEVGGTLNGSVFRATQVEIEDLADAVFRGDPSVIGRR